LRCLIVEILKLGRGFGWLLVSLFLASACISLIYAVSYSPCSSSNFDFRMPLVLFPLFFLGFFFILIRWDGKQVHPLSNAKLFGIALLALVLLFLLLNAFFFQPVASCVGGPVDAMHDGLGITWSKGFGITTAKKVTFENGALIVKSSVIRDIPISEDELQFACGDTAICNSDNLNVASDGSKIDANRRIEAQIVVCGDSEKPGVPRYCVGVGQSAEEARTACTSACGIA